MGPHGTWFDFIPGLDALKSQAQQHLGRTWTWQVFQSTYFEITHVLMAALVVVLLTLGALAYRARVSKLGDEAILPERKLNLRAVYEGLADMVFGVLDGVMGEKNAKRFLPFLGSFFLFILFSNLISLVPGFRAPTDTLKTNIGMALLVFLATHILGFKEHGLHYLEQFTGHLPLKSPLVVFVPLMFVIELISHFIRPATLSIRLMANMFADHAVVGVFFSIVPLFVPVPLMMLGGVRLGRAGAGLHVDVRDVHQPGDRARRALGSWRPTFPDFCETESRSGGNPVMYRNLKALTVSIFGAVALFPTAALAADGSGGGQSGLIAIGAGIAVGMAALGGALGQGRAASAALDGIARNPQASAKIFTPMIIALALTESLVLLAWLIAQGLTNKV